MNTRLIGILGGIACVVALCVIVIVGIHVYFLIIKVYGKASEIFSKIYGMIFNHYFPPSNVNETQVNKLNAEDFMESVSSQNDQVTQNQSSCSKPNVPYENICNSDNTEDSVQWTNGNYLSIDELNRISILGDERYSSGYDNEKALFELGCRYATGNGVEQNMQVAKGLILLSANKGYLPAINLLKKMDL